MPDERLRDAPAAIKNPLRQRSVAVHGSNTPSLSRYRYIYNGDRVMLVDLGSRTVVQEID